MLAATALLATSCSKDEVIEDVQLTVGYWSECYDNPNFSMDSSVRYTFKPDGTYTLEVYSAMVDTTIKTGCPVLWILRISFKAA